MARWVAWIAVCAQAELLDRQLRGDEPVLAALAVGPEGQLGPAKAGLALTVPAPAPALVELREKDGPVGEQQGYLDRLVESLVECVVGFFLIIFAIVALWINERRSADQWALFSIGESACVPLEDDTPDGTLVHTTGTTKTTETLTDTVFGVKVTEACRLRRKGKIYQWVEVQHGDRNTRQTTTYEAKKEWVDHWMDGGSFRSGPKDNGPRVSPEDLGNAFDATRLGLLAQDVSLGRTKLAQSQVEQLENWVPVASGPTKALGRDFTESMGMLTTVKNNEPAVGDIQMQIEKVPCGETTVVAVLVGDSYLPYKPVDPGLWARLTSVFKGRAPEDERQLLIEAGRDRNDGKLWSCTSLCCICNIVETFFHGMTPVQINFVAEKKLDTPQSFHQMESNETRKVWGIRFGGWLGMYIGLVMMFSPLIAVLSIIPFLAQFGSFLVYIFAFIVTAMCAILIISVAYLAYRPMLALFGFLLVAALGGMTQAPPVKAF